MIALPLTAGIRPTRAILYSRVSTSDQEERHTIDLQHDYGRRWCAANDIELVASYADPDVSGTIMLADRPEGNRLLREAAGLRAQLVLLYAWDRIGREPWVVWDGVYQLEKRLGLRIRSMTETSDTSTPEAVLMLCVHSGMASYERAKILQRSRDATEMLVRAGAWLGGIVPYGYRVSGSGREARIYPAETPLPGQALSEAEIVRTIYRLCAAERLSTYAIAARLTAWGIPPSYTRDEREPLLTDGFGNKRRRSTAGIWHPGRIGAMLTNPIYRGEHVWGKRAKTARETISRPMPAIVAPELWHAAQQALALNKQHSPRNTRNEYLLRGLMKCARCGRTYVGQPMGPGRVTVYYMCNSRTHVKPDGSFCDARSVNGRIEGAVWDEIERWARAPGDLLRELVAEQSAPFDYAAEIHRMEQLAAGIASQRDALLTLFRRGRIDGQALDLQLDQVTGEERLLADRLTDLRREATRHGGQVEAQDTAAAALERIGRALDQGALTFAERRRIVELLVERMEVETVERGDRRWCRVHAAFRFPGADHPPPKSTPDYDSHGCPFTAQSGEPGRPGIRRSWSLIGRQVRRLR